jgi:uncharacterized membrane protein YhaH (DUF805 family)
MLRNYTIFRDRARRRDFWSVIGLFLAALIVGGISQYFGGGPDAPTPLNVLGLFVEIAAALVILIPFWAVVVRRLHDLGRSGLWALVLALPIVGWLGLVVVGVWPGVNGDNRFGADPRSSSSASQGATA